MRRVSNSAVWYLVVCIIMSALMFIPMVHDVIASLGKEKTGSSLVTKDETTKSDTRAKIIEGYGKVPLHFIRNDGQIDKRVKYYEKGSGHAMYFTEEGVYLVLSRSKERGSGSKVTSRDVVDREIETRAVRLTFKNGKSRPEVVAEGELEGKVNYFIGNDPKRWRVDIPTYRSVLYKEVYKGIDIRFYGNQRQLEYDVIVRPGADPSAVRLAYEGIEGLRVNDRGELEVYVKGGDGKREIGLIQHRPVVYQEVDGKRREIEGSFEVLSRDRAKKRAIYAFKVGEYDKTRPLVIDPVLEYSTYLGGSGGDGGFGIAVDSSGNAYVTGETQSTNFPTNNAYQGTNRGSGDVFVAKLSASGNSLVYSTYLGGSGRDYGNGIAVDSLGNAYVTGRTDSTNFPTNNAYQGTNRGSEDAFVAKLSASGNSLVYSTYLGGSGWDYGNGIAVDSSGNAYVTGDTDSTNFPTNNAYQGTHGGGYYDAFVAKLSATGNSLVYSTYLGGSGGDWGNGIAVDSSGNAYVTGETWSTNFPTNNAYQGTYGGGGYYDVFVAKLSATGNSLVYSTYLGGSGSDWGWGIAVDSSGNAYVTGGTGSTNFPTNNAYQGTNRGSADVFVAKLSASGNSLVYSTYLGGSGEDWGNGIAVDSSGNAYVTGGTGSTNFPTNNAYQGTYGGGHSDVFVAKLSATGNSLVYSTYLGGSSYDLGYGIAVDSSGNAYVTGDTDSTNFPTNNAYQGTYGGSRDAFVAKISDTSLQSYTLTVTKTGTGSGTVTSSPSGINCGSTCSASFNSGTSVTLTATAASNSTFGGWSGDCSGTSTTCTVTMNNAKNVYATFNTGTTQCTYTISASPQTFSSSSGTGIVEITPSSTGCNAEWYLTSDSSWLNFTYTCGSGICTSRTINGIGGGTASFRVDANSGTSQRTGTISLTGGNSVTIRQDAGGSCTQCGISFTDVPTSSFSYNEILAIGCAGITQGCGVNLYCPSHNVSRAQMAAFIVRAKVGEPPADYCSSGSGFNDISASDGFCKYIKRLSELQITTGCGNGNYCPSDVVTRGQMAAFIIRALYGENFSYTTTPYFSDVPSSHVFFKYVQKMKDEGYTTVTGTYNVDGTVTREQMAAFLYRAFLKARCEGGTCSDAGVTVRVTNAVTGQGISGATVEVGGQRATTDSSGSARGDVRIVLTWGQNPADLDSHLTGPKTDGSTTRFHVYYAAKNNCNNAPCDRTIPAWLDVDDTTSYGPETITILSTNGVLTPGLYRYSVRHFSGSSNIPNSGAEVKVYRGTTLVGTYTPPPARSGQTVGSGWIWTVFEMTVSSSGSVSFSTINTYNNTGSYNVVSPIVTDYGSVEVSVERGEDVGIFMGLPEK